MEDIRAAPFPDDLDWSFDGRLASLTRMRAHVVGEHDRAITWYWESRKSFALFARGSRVIAVICSAIGGLLVLLPPGLTPATAAPVGTTEWALSYLLLPPVWLGMGALAMAMDRLYGWSDSWRRYVMTATQLEWSLTSFQMNWELRRNQWKANTPSEGEAQEAIRQAQRALEVLRSMVEAETRTWAHTLQQTQLDLENTFQQNRGQTPPIVQAQGTLTILLDTPVEGWDVSVRPAPERYERSERQIVAHGMPAGLASLSITVPNADGGTWTESRQVVVHPNVDTTVDVKRPANA